MLLLIVIRSFLAMEKRKLEEAGIEVTTGVLEAEAILLNRYFFHYMKTKRPFVTIKNSNELGWKKQQP
ncbi:hypothetical protein ACT7C4_08010 [Bacillus pacificus]